LTVALDNQTLELWLLGLGWGGLVLGAVLLYRSRRRRRWWLRWLLRGVGVPLLALAVVGLWYRYRPRPSARAWQSHPAVTVEVQTPDEPRPLVVSIARVDLSHPGAEVVTTEPGNDGRYEAATVLEFARAQQLDVAINSHFFFPFESNNPVDYYPREGDPVHAIGIAAADGTLITEQVWRGATVHFDRQPRGVLGLPDSRDALWDAVTGRNILVTAGQVQQPAGEGLAPRVGLGLADDGQTLLLVVVDGRQPGYSEGMTVSELATLMHTLGADDAIELDGGGSATLVVDDGDAHAVINCPIHTRVPGRMRPVASHIGVRFSG